MPPKKSADGAGGVDAPKRCWPCREKDVPCDLGGPCSACLADAQRCYFKNKCCRRCKETKIKCDMQAGGCSFCLQRGILCVYEERKKKADGPPRAHKHGLVVVREGEDDDGAAAEAFGSGNGGGAGAGAGAGGGLWHIWQLWRLSTWALA